MADLYERLIEGTDPLDLATVKAYIKVDSTADDVLLQSMIESAVDFATSYTGRQYRADTRWRVTMDDFDNRICLRRSPVSSIISVEYLVSSVWTTVSSVVYYLKKSPTWSEVLLSDGQTWPTDLDTIEHGVRIDFETAPHAHTLDSAKLGMLRMIAAMYDDRGDCEKLMAATSNGMPLAVFNDLARKSGAVQLWASARIPRI